LKSSFRSASDSSSLRPTMRFVNPGLIKSAFWPVACKMLVMQAVVWNRRTTYRMDPHNRMLTLYRFPSYEFSVPPCIFSLLESRMLSSQSLQQFFYRIAQSLISSDLANPRRIATRLRHIQQRQDRDARCLVLVGHIAVISRGCELGGSPLSAVLIVWAKVDVVELNCVLNMSSNWMDM
jgi:hypothetical protein